MVNERIRRLWQGPDCPGFATTPLKPFVTRTMSLYLDMDGVGHRGFRPAIAGRGGEAGLINPLITATAGWSEAVEERARRLLGYQIGSEAEGAAVTVRTMLERSGYDPVASARFLMAIPPLSAVRELGKTIAAFRIDGEPCPDPLASARAALSHAGRAVAVHELHPERRFLANLIALLLGRPRSSQ